MPKAVCPKCHAEAQCFCGNKGAGSTDGFDEFVLFCSACGHTEKRQLGIGSPDGGFGIFSEEYPSCPFCGQVSTFHQKPRRYELSYLYFFEWFNLGTNKVKRLQPFEAEDDKVAKEWAEAFIAERNNFGEDGGDSWDLRGDCRERRKGHDFKMTKLTKIVE